MQAADPAAVKHAAYNATIHPEIDTRIQELEELSAFLEKEGVEVEELWKELKASQSKLARLGKQAGEIQARLQRDAKYKQLKPDASDALRNILLFSDMPISNNPKHTVFAVGYAPAMESIRASLSKLQEKEEQCEFEEEVERFFGQGEALAGARAKLRRQRVLLLKLGAIWDTSRDLAAAGAMPLHHPRARDVHYFLHWKKHLNDVIGEERELWETDVVCEAEHMIENAIQTSKWLDRFSIAGTQDVMALSRIIYNLTGLVLSPPTFASLAQSEAVLDGEMQKLLAQSGRTEEEEEREGHRVSPNDLCIRRSSKVKGVGEGT
eukprot:1153266-Rhodomonas_salina.1